MPVDVDADDLASKEDSVYLSSSSSSSSSENPPNSESAAPLEDMEMEPPEAELILLLKTLQCQILLLHTTPVC